VACAGTGLKEAVALLETLSNDPVSYVRQGALVASALVLIQQNDCTSSRVAHFRQLYSKVNFRLLLAWICWVQMISCCCLVFHFVTSCCAGIMLTAWLSLIRALAVDRSWSVILTTDHTR
jgi:hypothetical protein